LTRVHAFGTKQQFGITLVTVGVLKLNLGHGGTTTGIVQNLLDNATNVAVFFGIIEGTKLDGTLARTGVRRKDASLSFTL
jgi:hypothetical protein